MGHKPGKMFTVVSILVGICAIFSGCGIYTFKDASLPSYVKTIKINYIENHASIINPQLSSKVTDQFKTTVQSNLRKASLVNADNADYIISGYISEYRVSTSGVGSTQATSNRLTVGVHLILNNTVKSVINEYDISRDFDFSASLTLTQAENQLLPDIIKNVTDEMFNRIFSSW